MKERLALWFVSGMILASVVFWANDAAAAEAVSVKVHSPSFDISVIPLYVAKDKGYFAEQGLEPTIVLAADNIGIQALIAGEFDFTASATGASRANARNFPLKVVVIH